MIHISSPLTVRTFYLPPSGCWPHALASLAALHLHQLATPPSRELSRPGVRCSSFRHRGSGPRRRLSPIRPASAGRLCLRSRWGTLGYYRLLLTRLWKSPYAGTDTYIPSKWMIRINVVVFSLSLILAKAVLTQSRWGDIRARLLSTSLVLSLKVSSRDAGAVTQPRHAQNNCPVHWQSANRVVSCTNNLISYDIFSCTRVKVHPVFSGVPFFCASYFFHLHYLIYADSVVKPSHSEDIREEAACRASGPRNKREPHCE